MENMKITEESAINMQSFPQGSLIDSNLSSLAVGNLLEVHEFLCRFYNILELEVISFKELETELCGIGKSSIVETVEWFVHNFVLTKKMMDLKIVYPKVILNITKEAAARVMVTEPKAARFEFELQESKENSMQMLMRLKQMMDRKVYVLEKVLMLITLDHIKQLIHLIWTWLETHHFRCGSSMDRP